MESRPQVLDGSLPSKVHLWDSELGQNESSVDACWVTDLNSSRDALWPFLSDTSSLNQRLGLPEMEFEERDGRLSGVSGRKFLRQEWVEIPWEWETGKWLLAERRYSRGFARAVRVRYLLEDHHDGTRFTVSIGWIPTYWWSPLVLRSINHWLRRQYARVLRDIDKLAGNSEEKPTAPIASVETRVSEDRLCLGVCKLTESGFSPEEVERLADYIRTASDQSLYRIRPRKLALEWSMELQDLLALLLQATRSGILRLSWDVMCPHCKGVRKESRSLGDLREFGRCDVCDIDFDATRIESVEVTFRILPEIREIREVFYCSAEPAKKPHIIVQHQLAPGETYGTELKLLPGRYRLRRNSGDQVFLAFEVHEAKGAESIDWNTNDQVSGEPLLVRSKVSMKLGNPEVERVTIVVEKVFSDPMALRPSELFNLQRFRDLFCEESIASGLNLEMGHQTLLFTDIVGSTQLYSELGDTKAFNAVHSHFVALQEIIASRKGAVVKTIGDAMMAGFLNPEDAVNAAVDIQERFRPGAGERVALRVSIHRDTCLAVRLDSNIDYFGNAVNFAAKMQSVPGGGEIAFSEQFFSLPGISERTQELGLNVEEQSFLFGSGAQSELTSVFVASIAR